MQNLKSAIKSFVFVAASSLFFAHPLSAQMPDIAKEFGLQKAQVAADNEEKEDSLKNSTGNQKQQKNADVKEFGLESHDVEPHVEPLRDNPVDLNEINEASVEDLKQQMLELNRDLLILEEELLFPSSTQVSVFLSMDAGSFFQMDSVRLEINGKQVATHLYTDRQLDALHRGGVQRLHMGNIKSGTHEITAFFIGEGTHSRDYKRAATIDVEKSQDPLILELVVRDSAQKLQPEFEFQTWTL